MVVDERTLSQSSILLLSPVLLSSDGVEEDNTISFNLAAHIHKIGPIPWGGAQTTKTFKQTDFLTLPADVTASGYYITNVHNNLIGNAASGVSCCSFDMMSALHVPVARSDQHYFPQGWSGYAFPSLRTALGVHRTVNIKPTTVTSLTLDGNTAHSTGWWWSSAGSFYFGGALYYTTTQNQDVLEYNPGRSFSHFDDGRDTCAKNPCTSAGQCGYCGIGDQRWVRLTNSKAFLSGGPGLVSFSLPLARPGENRSDLTFACPRILGLDGWRL